MKLLMLGCAALLTACSPVAPAVDAHATVSAAAPVMLAPKNIPDKRPADFSVSLSYEGGSPAKISNISCGAEQCELTQIVGTQVVSTKKPVTAEQLDSIYKAVLEQKFDQVKEGPPGVVPDAPMTTLWVRANTIYYAVSPTKTQTLAAADAPRLEAVRVAIEKVATDLELVH